MDGVYDFQVIVVPNEDESFSPIEKERVPNNFEYKEDKLGLTYTLEFLWKFGIRKVLIVCRDEGENSQIAECIDGFEGDISIKQVGDSNGTADRLKKLELPTGDSFLVIVGNPDLSVNLCSVSDLYKRKQCHCAMVLKKGERSKEDNNKANHIYGITDDGIVISFSEVVARSKTYNLPKALLYEYPSFSYYTKLIDCNIYFCTRSLLNKLQLINDMSDFKADFLVTLIRRQHTYHTEEYQELRNSIQAYFIYICLFQLNNSINNLL